MGTPWLIVVVIGPILLAVAILYAMTRNKAKNGPGDEAHSDQAARQLRRELNAEDKVKDQQRPYT